ncbi:MAG TPA: hypothetical protein VG253_05385 [Streptosporangiaceae bacterium]|nr:hypothetical protein [Streptosporangiaceae bacterium]
MGQRQARQADHVSCALGEMPGYVDGQIEDHQPNSCEANERDAFQGSLGAEALVSTA